MAWRRRPVAARSPSWHRNGTRFCCRCWNWWRSGTGSAPLKDSTVKSFPPKNLESLAAAWEPSPDFIETTNLAWLMRRVGVSSYEALHAWSAQNREAYWELAIE